MEALAALYLRRSRSASVSPVICLPVGDVGDPTDGRHHVKGRVHRCPQTSCPVHVLRWGICWGLN